MELRLWPHPDLKKVCPPVELDDPLFASQLEVMKKTMVAGDGVGLAANQLGILKRMLVALQSKGDAPLHFVNPKVVGYAGKWVDVREGCLSLPGFFDSVKRNTVVVVEHLDLASRATKVESFTGLLGHVLQHEIEHLDGVMFVDKLKPAARDQLRAFLRKNPPRARR